jgi:polar amino acid transport system substrate-binding protein
MRTRRILTATALTAGMLTLAACGSSEPAASGTATGDASEGGDVQLVNAGQLTICSDIPYPPFEFQQEGEIVGYDIDIATRIAKDLGVEPNVVDSSFEAIESGAALTGCDILISSISITEARQQVMAFSDPYLNDDLILVAKEGSGVTDLESAKGKKVGVQAATTGERYAEENGLSPIQFEDGGLQVEALRSGTVDALLGNQSLLLYSIKDNPEMKVMEEFSTGEQLGIGVSKDKPALLEAVNTSLADMKKDGSLEESMTTWFGDASAAVE